jgi:DJ-1/PfpI family protein
MASGRVEPLQVVEATRGVQLDRGQARQECDRLCLGADLPRRRSRAAAGGLLGPERRTHLVPAFLDPENGTTRDWLRAQAAKGATLVSMCDGSLVVAGTGLLDGRRATGQFASADKRREQFPTVHWVANTRFVHDGQFISSSGVSASLPTAMYLVELIAGAERALEVAHTHGLASYDGPAHVSDAFHMGLGDLWLGAKNYLLGWPRDVYALELASGVDEVLSFTVGSCMPYSPSAGPWRQLPYRDRGVAAEGGAPWFRSKSGPRMRHWGRALDRCDERQARSATRGRLELLASQAAIGLQHAEIGCGATVHGVGRSRLLAICPPSATVRN